jgi:spore germination protein YaaH
MVIGILLIGAIAVLPRLAGSGPPGASGAPPVLGGGTAGDRTALPTGATVPIPTTAVSPSAVPTPAGPPRVRALAGREVLGFLPYWKLGQPATNVDLPQLTTIAYFGVEAHQAGHLIRRTAAGRVPSGWAGFESAAFADLLTKAHAAKVRVVLTVQRFAWTAGQARRTVKLLQDPVARSALAMDIASVVKDRGLDGINLDWEPVPGLVRDDFTTFVRELRVALDGVRAGLQLTFDVTTAVSSYDLAALTADDGADAAVVMGYDYRVRTAARAGSTAPLDDGSGSGLRETVAAALAVTSRDRVILALPWYGRAWSTVSADPHAMTQDPAGFGASQTVEYANAVKQAQLTGRLYDDGEASAWTVYQAVACRGCPETWRQLWYDDVDSVQAKVGFALAQGLRGIGIWALGHDGTHPELWSALGLALGTASDERAPTGSATLDTSLVPALDGRKEQGLPVVQGVVRLVLRPDDGARGSGPAFVRVSGTPEMNGQQLAVARTYPSVPSLDVSLADASIGATAAIGPRTLYVQWRDVAGNWSAVRSLQVWNRRGLPVTPPGSASPSPSALPIPSATTPPY